MAQEMHKTKESDRRKKRAEEVLMSQLETLQRNLSSLFRLEEKGSWKLVNQKNTNDPVKKMGS